MLQLAFDKWREALDHGGFFVSKSSGGLDVFVREASLEDKALDAICKLQDAGKLVWVQKDMHPNFCSEGTGFFAHIPGSSEVGVQIYMSLQTLESEMHLTDGHAVVLVRRHTTELERIHRKAFSQVNQRLLNLPDERYYDSEQIRIVTTVLKAADEI